MNNTVVFVLSSNYSGSTWLALLLGSHSQACYVGELHKMFHSDPVPCRLCEEKQRRCPVFHDVAAVKIKNIHAHVFARTGKKVLVDNSKTVGWSRKFLREGRFRKKYIHLLRDPRAIAYSLQLRNRAPETEEWIKKNFEIRDFLQAHRLDFRAITYNGLAERTDETLAALAEWLGLDYEPGQKEYWNFEHHGPGRNGATAAFLDHYVASDDQFYAQRKRTNFHDLRWQQQLHEDSRVLIERDAELRALLREMNLALGEAGLSET